MTPSDLVNKWHMGCGLTCHHLSVHTHETPVALLFDLEDNEWLYVPPGYELDWPVFGEQAHSALPISISSGRMPTCFVDSGSSKGSVWVAATLLPDYDSRSKKSTMSLLDRDGRSASSGMAQHEATCFASSFPRIIKS